MKNFAVFLLALVSIQVSAATNPNPLRRACIQAGGTPRVLDVGSPDSVMMCLLADGAFVGAFDLLTVASGGTTPAIEAYKGKTGCTGNAVKRTDSEYGPAAICEFSFNGSVSAIEDTMLTNKRLYPEFDRLISR